MRLDLRTIVLKDRLFAYPNPSEIVTASNNVCHKRLNVYCGINYHLVVRNRCEFGWQKPEHIMDGSCQQIKPSAESVFGVFICELRSIFPINELFSQFMTFFREFAHAIIHSRYLVGFKIQWFLLGGVIYPLLRIEYRKGRQCGVDRDRHREGFRFGRPCFRRFPRRPACRLAEGERLTWQP